ncbi:MAG: sel1 repeat family protein [Prevotella sp.]|nr:sel1 repeat family protein [Prevotella sp.]
MKNTIIATLFLLMINGCGGQNGNADNRSIAELTSKMTNDDARRLMRQAITLDQRHQYIQAACCYRLAAELGLSEAQNNLGVMYKDGQGVLRDYAEAAKWFLRAAEQDNILAQSNLGWLYQAGKGVARDFAEARKWYLAAACRGHAAAQNNLGTLYRDGQGVPQNHDSARYWFEQAAAQDMALARRNLEKMKGEQ